MDALLEIPYAMLFLAIVVATRQDSRDVEVMKPAT